MSTFVLLISALLGVMLIVTATTTINMIEYVSQKHPKKRKKESARRSILKKGKYKRKDKHVTLSSGPEKMSTSVTSTVESGTENLKILEEIDEKLDKYAELESCLRKLKQLNSKYPENPRILWMIGKAHQKTAEKTNDPTIKDTHVDQGIEACAASVELNYNQPDAHKWMAALIGYKGQSQPIKERIKGAQLFKKHLDTAMDLNPTDPLLHHMVGRFCFELSSLKWVERKIANSMFTEPPDCSFEKALEHFLLYEKLSNNQESKENKLFIAKCYIAIENYEQAVEWLDKAKSAHDEIGEKFDKEINSLLSKYETYQ